MFSSKCAFPCLKKGCWNSMTELFSAVIIPFSRAITFLKPSVDTHQSHFFQCKADCNSIQLKKTPRLLKHLKHYSQWEQKLWKPAKIAFLWCSVIWLLQSSQLENMSTIPSNDLTDRTNSTHGRGQLVSAARQGCPSNHRSELQIRVIRTSRIKSCPSRSSGTVYLPFHAYNPKQLQIKTNAVMYHQGLQNKGGKISSQPMQHMHTEYFLYTRLPAWNKTLSAICPSLQPCFEYHRVDTKYSWRINFSLFSLNILT